MTEEMENKRREESSWKKGKEDMKGR